MTRKTKILIADDSESLARSMSLVLRRRGYEITTARDGVEAVRLALAEDFDLIFLDVKMPNLNGVDAFNHIRAQKPEAAVVMMTAYTVEHLVQRALSDGVYRVLRKPLDMEQILQLITRVTAQREEGPTLLLVDDHEVARSILARILRRHGCTVHTASNGEDAIALAREQSFHLVFLDMKLPTIDGLDTYLGIKEAQPTTPVVLMTAFWEETAERVKTTLDSCAKACLRKPLNIEEVLQLVEHLTHATRHGSAC